MKGTIQPDWNNKVDLSTQGIAEVFNTLDTSGGFSLSDEIPVNISGTPYKITGQTLANIVGGGGAQQAGLTNYIKNCGTISSLPTTLTDSNITSDMIVLEATLGTPSVLTSDLTVTTANGSVTISGSISGSTTLTIVFGVGYTVAPTILTNLGSSTPDNILKADPRPGVTGVLPVANGGTNSSTVAGARTNLDVYSKSETNNAIQQSMATAWLKKRENITVTTDANGNAQIQSVPSDPIKVILFAWDGSHIFIPFYYGNTWYCRVQYTNAAGDILANTSVTFNIYYLS